MTPIRTPGKRFGATVPAVLLLALCLLAVGVQALTDTPALVIDGPGLYTLDHDLASDATVGVLINGSNVVFDGMGHTVTGTNANGSAGILVSGRTTVDGEMGTNVTVRNVTVSGWDDGIRIAETSDTVVERVVAEQNGNGLTISPTTGIASGHVIRESVFRNNTGSGVFRGNGIFLIYPAEGITVERCAITGNGVGISADEISHGAPNTLADSEISGNAGDGLNSHTGSFAVVRNCTVSANGDDGLEFEHGGAEIVGCHIEENAAAGVHVSDRGGSDIHGNWIEGNGVGILAGGDWPSHVRNNVLNNTDNGYFGIPYDSGYMNYTKSAGPNIVGGPYLGGNAWAFPNGTGFSQTHPDTNGDGFCDEPYHLSEDATDYLPLALLNGTPTPTPTPTPPFGGRPYKLLSVPGRIQAEDYNLGGEGTAYHDTTPGNEGGAYRHDDVDIEIQGAVTNVGWIRNGEFLTYTANVTTAGTYTLTARVASPNSGRTIAVSQYGNPVATITVPNTGSFGTFRDVVVPITLGAGTQVFRLTFAGDGQNLDWFELSPYVEPTPTPTVTPTPTPEINGTPYKPLAIPGTIQAEDYDLGGEGVAYHDTTPGNEGGAYRHDDVDIEKQAGLSTPNVGWIRDGEYLRYTVNVAQTGDYYLALRVASPNSYRNVVVSVDDGWQGMWVQVPNTGSFERFATAVEWSTVTLPSAGVTATMTPAPTATGGFTFGKNPVHLTAGTHTLKLGFSGDGQNLDWIAFEPVGATPTPTPTPEAGGASFSAVPTTAPYGSAVKFTVTPAAGKAIASAWWSFDATAHLNTWNSRVINPTFFYPQRGTFSPLVKLTYTDGSTETVQRTGYLTAT